MKKLGNAQEAARWAAGILENAERSNSDIIPLRNEEQEGYGIFQLALGVRERLFGAGGKYNRALTIAAVTGRIPGPGPNLLFRFLYGRKNHEILHELCGVVFRSVRWPTDSGGVHPYIGVGIAKSILLRHYWFKSDENISGRKDFDKSMRAMSPTKMSGFLSMPLSEDKRNGRMRPFEFIRWQQDNVLSLLDLWERQAESFVNGELADKDILS
jgi:hypothetical protein